MSAPAIKLTLPTPEQIAEALAVQLAKQLPNKWWLDVADATGTALGNDLGRRVDLRALQADVAASFKPPEVHRGGAYE